MKNHLNITKNGGSKHRRARESIPRFLTLLITVSLCANDLLLYFGGNQIESMSSKQYL